MRNPEHNLRANLRSSVAASAAPYGYTLTIFSTGSVGAHLIGKPHVFQVLLYVAGAVLAFVFVGTLAFGSFRVQFEHREPPAIAIWGNAHLLSAGLAIGISWVSLQLVQSGVGWLMIGFLCTATYLILNAVQMTVAVRSTD